MHRPELPRSVLGLTWREHIGGRWAVSRIGFLVLLPILVISPLSNMQHVTPSSVAPWLASSLVSLIPLGVLWWLASVTILRQRRLYPVSIWLVVLIGVVSGSVRSATMTWITVETGLFVTPMPLDQLVITRMTIGAVQGAVGMPMVAMMLSVIARYRSERARLLDQAARVLQRSEQAKGATEALRRALAGPVRARLQELADRLNDDATQVPAVADDVREQAHELWTRGRVMEAQPRVRLRDVMRAAMRNRPLPLTAVFLIWIPSAFLSFTLRESLRTAIAQTVVGAAILVVVYIGGTALVRRTPRLGVLIFFLGTVGGGALSVWCIWLLTQESQWSESAFLTVSSIPWLVAVTLIVSVVESAAVRSGEVLDEIRAGIEESEIVLHREQRQRVELAHEVASVLHGVVQGRLTIAQRSSSDATTLARQALDEGIELLSGRTVVAETRATEIVRRTSDPWSALMEVELCVDDGLIDAGRVHDLSDVLEECLSNAFRHGAAKHVKISVTCEKTLWTVTVVDDGVGLTHPTVPGLGSRLFDAVSEANWSRVLGDDGGCVVTVRLT